MIWVSLGWGSVSFGGRGSRKGFPSYLVVVALQGLISMWVGVGGWQVRLVVAGAVEGLAGEAG